MATVVGVRFKNAGKLYYFDPGKLWPAAGSFVVVETARGVEYGQVITGVREVDDELIASPLKQVLRIGTAEDAKHAVENEKFEKEAYGICQHKIEEHKNEKSEEPCLIDKSEAGEMLRYCGVEEEKIEAFEEKFDECFGSDAQIPTTNISAGKKLEVTTPEVSIKIDASASDVVETRIIDGTKYILIRADNGAIVNGVNVKF